MFSICLGLICLCSHAQVREDIVDGSVDKLQQMQQREAWLDSVIGTMSLDEQIAQFFMVAAYSNKGPEHEQYIDQLISQYHIGGLIFMQGGPYRQVELTNHYQSLAQIKLMIGMDAEWGLAMRLKDSTMAFPYQLTLGAIKDDNMIYLMGKEVARQCRRMGVHVNFAPVVDVNVNPANPVINFRSFGEDKLNVSLKGLAYMEGLQDGGVMACAKHFPGHGDTDSDSHLTLPVIRHSVARLKDIELYPFKILINNGVGSIMAAHLFIPALDDRPNRPTSLSRPVVTGLLKKEMGFQGLVFSDALNMKGVSQFYGPGAAALEAFIAGNDVLLFADDVPKGIELIKQGLADGQVDSLEFNQRLRKLLAAKYNAGLAHFEPISTDGLYDDLHHPKAQLLQQELYAQAVTVAADKDHYLPVKELDKPLAVISLGSADRTVFQEYVSRYARVTEFNLAKDAAPEVYNGTMNMLTDYETVFISLHDMSQYSSKGYGIDQQEINFINELSQKTRVVLVVFGNPYSLKYFPDLEHVVVAYQENEVSQHVAAEVIFGAREATGTLPVSASDKYKYGTGVQTPSLGRLQYTLPEAVGVDSKYFRVVDSLANLAIADKATPGCEILVALKGKVIYYKGYGYHTYDSIEPVQPDDIYDLASITKVGATTISLMHLYDEKKFMLNRRMSDYLPMLDSTDLKNIINRDVLAHKAGLKPWIPFYVPTMVDSVYKVCYKTSEDSMYCLPVMDNLFMRSDYKDTIFHEILATTLNKKKEYVYSDLGFILYKELIERVTGQQFARYTDSMFYAPLGMGSMGFNPLDRFPLKRIVPTEDDKVFRKGLVHGYVHDPAAAMLGGVSGHAGLFSDANDLAILMQMLLNEGTYAGKRYLERKTVELFTKRNDDDSRRGLGFDKPEPDPNKPGPTAEIASLKSFGHSGFTGTCVWADPDAQLIYVFLSNRVNPTADNHKLVTNNVRTDIHQAIYDAIINSARNQVVSK